MDGCSFCVDVVEVRFFSSLKFFFWFWVKKWQSPSPLHDALLAQEERQSDCVQLVAAKWRELRKGKKKRKERKKRK
jgi:hypothetical protein